jgi:hypothetical protein
MKIVQPLSDLLSMFSDELEAFVRVGGNDFLLALLNHMVYRLPT